MRVQPGQLLPVHFQMGTVCVLPPEDLPEVCLTGAGVLFTAAADGAADAAERNADSINLETSAFLPRCRAGELMNSSSRALVTAT
ncbi:hypothetical protein D3C73_1383340 [compost metagenome]